MGVDISFNCIAGVMINPKSGYITKTVHVDPRCEHVKKLQPEPAFCPSCGRKTLKPYAEEVHQAREDLIKKLGCEVITDYIDDHHIIDWVNTNKKLPFQFCVRSYSDEEVWCGTYLGSGHSDDGTECRKEIPEIPNRKELFNFLDSLNLDYDPDSYGIWTIVERH